jgi:hypothetical protein
MELEDSLLRSQEPNTLSQIESSPHPNIPF